MDIETTLACAISLLCFCLTVFGHQVRLSRYNAVSLLSGVIYNDHILSKSNESSILSCALLCRQNPQCLSMSYNVDDEYCQIFKIVYCSSSQGIPSNGTNYYIAGFEDPQPYSIYLKCKDTKQSSTNYGGLSRFATDGIWEVDYYVKPCTHTKFENRPWWYVDLRTNYIIHKIKLLNRVFGTLRLRKLILSVGEDLQSMTQCGYRANKVPSGQNATIICDPPTKGRFVRILLNAVEFLTICEISVYGSMVHD